MVVGIINNSHYIFDKFLLVSKFSLLFCVYCTGFTAVFTNLGKSGEKGSESIGSYYTGQDHDGQVAVSSGIQQWTVPHTGEYRIEAIGASGGYGEESIIKNGGRGARMIGHFNLTKDEIIHVLVGQKGKRGNNNKQTAGGGGGTFVVKEDNTPLIIAGGGGGIKNMLEQHLGCDASTNTTGNAGDNSPLGSGGSNGHGGRTNSRFSGRWRIFFLQILRFSLHSTAILQDLQPNERVSR